MKSDTKAPMSPAMRLREKIQKNMAGQAAPPITMKLKLTGTDADNWRAIQDAAEGLGMDNTGLLSVLLMYGTNTVRAALKNMPRP